MLQETFKVRFVTESRSRRGVMRNKVIVGLLVVVVIILAGTLWFMRASRNNAPLPSVAAIPQTQPSSKALILPSTKQTANGSAFHFYSPLHDPPPVATADQLQHWHTALRTALINEIKPDLNGPPLASIYNDEAADANKGDVQAATTLPRTLLMFSSNITTVRG